MLLSVQNPPLLWETGFPGGASGKEPTCQCRRLKRCGFDPWVKKIPWRRAQKPTPVLLPGESHDQRSLAGYRPQGRKESDRAEETWQARVLWGLMFLSTFPALLLLDGRGHSFLTLEICGAV